MEIKLIKRRWAFIAASVIFLSSLGLQTLGAWQDSPTRDEPSHMVDGLAYWQTGSFEFNYPHPPLAKILPGLALFIAGARIDTSTDAWKKQDTEKVNAQVLYSDSWRHTRWLTFVARLPMLLFSGLLIALVWYFARRRFGDWPALAATAIIAFDPNIIGHGPLVNTDIPMTAMFFAAALSAESYFRQPQRRSLVVLSVVIALAILTKFSAIIIWPLVMAIGLGLVVFQRQKYSWRQLGRLVSTSLATIIVLAALVYQFEGAKPNRTGFPTWKVAVGSAEVAPWPPSYWHGLYYNLRHNAFGHRTVFRGEVIHNGRLAYFPIALVTKTPIPTLLLWLGALLAGTWWLIKRRPVGSAWILVVFPALYAATALQSNLNIGIRHILPLWPFLAIAVAWFIFWLQKQQVRLSLTCAMLAFLTIPLTALAYPATISYFNGLAGGTKNGPHWFIDSNTDWGQDAWRVADYLERQPGRPIQLSLFSTAPRDLVGPGALAVPDNKQIVDYTAPLGRVILSDALLYAPDRGLGWPLTISRDLRPERIGTTVTVFHFP